MEQEIIDVEDIKPECGSNFIYDRPDLIPVTSLNYLVSSIHANHFSQTSHLFQNNGLKNIDNSEGCKYFEYKFSTDESKLNSKESAGFQKSRKPECRGLYLKDSADSNSKTYTRKRRKKKVRKLIIRKPRYYKCAYCKFKRKFLKLLYRHFNLKHRYSKLLPREEIKYKDPKEYSIKAVSSKKLFACPKCDYKTFQKIYLYYHISTCHNTDGLYRCKYCDFVSLTDSEMEKHLIIHPESDLMFSCSYCPYVTKQKLYLHRHLKLHGEETLKLFECSQCYFVSLYQPSLVAHKTYKHSSNRTIKIYHCTHCEYKSGRRCNVRMHIESKHNDSTEIFKCSVCPYVTKAKRNLKDHFKFKHDERREVLQCPDCDYSTRKKYNMTKHLTKIHTNEVFHCVFCELQTKRKGDLRLHLMRKHRETLEIATENDNILYFPSLAESYY